MIAFSPQEVMSGNRRNKSCFSPQEVMSGNRRNRLPEEKM
jgi:hypothetical protein